MNTESYIVSGTCFDFPTCVLFLSHSCAPNCLWVSNKNKLQLLTMRDIGKGEGLTVAKDQYKYSLGAKRTAPTIFSQWTGRAHRKRVKHIKARWRFDCSLKCLLCKGSGASRISRMRGTRADKNARRLLRFQRKQAERKWFLSSACSTEAFK